MVTDADGESLPHGNWARCVDDALDELVDAHDDHLAIGARGCLTDMIEDGMRLTGVAGAEDCKHRCADRIIVIVQYENFVDELALHPCGIGVCLLEVEILAAEGNWPTLEAWIDYAVEYLLGGHRFDVPGTVIGHQDICGARTVGHIDRCLGQFDVVHRFDDGGLDVLWPKQVSKIEAELDSNEANVLLATIMKHIIDGWHKDRRIAGDGCVVDLRAGAIVE